MSDMLVRLYDLPDLSAVVKDLRAKGVEIRRAIVPETHIVSAWVRRAFQDTWATECQRAMCNTPASCFVAIENGVLLGFGCYDATCRNFFGPTGVAEASRGRGIGKALLWACLNDMAAQGYAYAIIGWAGPTEFYRKLVGAEVIEGSTPGIFRGMLKPQS